MSGLDRRKFLGVAASAVLTPALPVTAWGMMQPAGLSPVMATRLHTMREALAEFDIAARKADALWANFKDAGLIGEDTFQHWYKAQPSTIAHDAALARGCAAVEAVFMTPPETMPDDDAVMEAFEAYAEVAPSAFAIQTARDLFTPYRHQQSPAAFHVIRDGLLTDPDEAFAKSDMPWFLKAIREQHRRLT